MLDISIKEKFQSFQIVILEILINFIASMTIPDLRLIFKETVYIGGGRGWTGGFSHNLFSFFDTFIQQIVELVPCYMQVPMNFLILFAFFIMTFSLLLSLMIGLD